MSWPGLRFTDQATLPGGDTIVLDDPPQAPRDLWMQLASTDAFQYVLKDALSNAPTSVTSDAKLLEDALADHGITAITRQPNEPGLQNTPQHNYATETAAAIHALENENPLPFFEFVRLTRQLGRQTTDSLQTTIEDIHDGPLALFDLTNTTPSIVLDYRGTNLYDDLRRSQRTTLLRFIVDLAQVCDVRLVASGFLQRRLAHDHADDLPASLVNEATKPRQTTGSTGARTDTDDTAVTDAISSLGWDAPHWTDLCILADEPTQQRPLTAFYTDPRIRVGDSAIRKRLLRLEDLGLVESIQWNGDATKRLTRAGQLAVDAYRDEFGDDNPPVAGPGGAGSMEHTRHDAPQNDDTADSGGTNDSRAVGGACEDPPKTPREGRVTPNSQDCPPDRPAGEAADSADSGAGTLTTRSPRTEWLSMSDHHATAAAAPTGGFALCDRNVSRRGNAADRLVSYDADRDEVVVSIQASPDAPKNPLRLCAALLSENLQNEVLTRDRIDAAGKDFGGLSVQNPYVLRKGPCMGYLKNEDANAAAYLKRLNNALYQLFKDSTDLRNGDGEYQPDVARQLTRDAQGLLGTLEWLYHLMGVDVVHEIRIPEYSRNFHDKRDALLEFFAKAVPISSQFGLYNAHRVLFEPRPGKRDDALGAPTIEDGSVGSLLGSWVISGNGVTKLSDDLEDLFSNPLPVQYDGENFAPVTIKTTIEQGWRRSAIAELVTRLGRFKGLEKTQTAISIFQAFTGSLRAVGDAMMSLGREDTSRTIRVDELRYALSTLDPDRLLPSTSKLSIRKVVSVLLDATGPLSQAELADRADISTQTLRNHRDLLTGLGLIDIMDQDAGRSKLWRLRLSFTSERNDTTPVVPDVLDDDSDLDRVAFVLEQLFVQLGHDIKGDPLLERAFWQYPQNPLPVIEANPWLRPWVEVILALLGEDVRYQLCEGPPKTPDWADPASPRQASFGARPPTKQATLDTAIAD